LHLLSGFFGKTLVHIKKNYRKYKVTDISGRDRRGDFFFSAGRRQPYRKKTCHVYPSCPFPLPVSEETK
jgi:hypothetical protein